MTPIASELTVIIKNSESKYTQRFLCYEAYELQPYNPWVQSCIEEARKMFHGEPEEIKIKAALQVR